MNAVGATSATSVARGPGQARAHAGIPATLLPSPSSDFSGLGGLQDALLVAYADRAAQGINDGRMVAAEVAHHRAATAIEQKKMTEARERRQAEERASHGFWSKLKKVASTVAKVAGVVAGAAACVATAGMGAPFVVAVAALALSAGGTAVRELKLAGKDSDKIGMGMEIAGAVVGAGAGLAGAGSATASGLDASSKTASQVSSAATLTSATATATAAGAGIGVAYHEREARMAEADVAEALAQIDRHTLENKLLIQAYAEGQEAERDALAGTMKAIEAVNQAADVAIAGVRA